MTFVQLIVLLILAAVFVSIAAAVLSGKSIPDIKSNDDVLELLKNGHRIAAIKAYRQLHGVGLKDAKKYIDKHTTTEVK